MRKNEREPLFLSSPLHFERIYFPSADVAREQRRVIGGEPEPLPPTAGRHATNLADFRDILDLAIADAEADDSVRLARCRSALEVEIFSIMRPHRVTHLTIARFRPLLCGGVEEHQL
jgi:hypothetical protein